MREEAGQQAGEEGEGGRELVRRGEREFEYSAWSRERGGCRERRGKRGTDGAG